jgi:sarcosine oxidase, subunit beta
VASHQALGVDTRVLTAAEAAEIEPLLNTSDITHVAYEPHSGYADAHATVYGFVEGAIAHGAFVRTHTPATSIVVEGGKVVAVETAVGRIATGTVVLVGGAWANQLLHPLGVDLAMEPHRVKVVLFRWPIGMDQQRKHAVIIDSTEHSWLRTAGINTTLIGIEHDPIEIDPDDYDETVDNAYIGRCRKALARRLPIFADANMLGSWAGVVMQSSDGHPVIDRIDAVPGLFLMAGDSGTSFKTAPAIGVCLAEWVIDGAPKLADLTPFRASRFAEGKPWTDPLSYSSDAEITVSR